MVGVAFVGKHEGEDCDCEEDGEGCEELETETALDSEGVEHEGNARL